MTRFMSMCLFWSEYIKLSSFEGSAASQDELLLGVVGGAGNILGAAISAFYGFGV
ncbi:hypothetical protein SAMN06298226_1810 [Nitrosovibrio sp. Nv4]|nr:hypothetical protein SAMN06298226_1810 [Nitrosovibrio sp. Nv4]